MSTATNRTKRRIKEIKSVWEPGASASVIAARLSWKPSRNSVIGMFHRHAALLSPCTLSSQNSKNVKHPTLNTSLRFTQAKEETETKAPTLQKETISCASVAAQVDEPTVPMIKDPKIKPNPGVEVEFKVDLGASYAQPDDYADTEHNFLCVEIFDHKEGQCRWPSSGVTNITYCGCDTFAGGMYCARHTRRGTKPGVAQKIKKVWR